MKFDPWPWLKIGVAAIVILVIDVLLSFLTNLGDFYMNQSKTVIISNLLLLEGALTLSLGGLVALGSPAQRMESFGSLFARPGGHAEYLRQHRAKQFSFGVAMMIVGGILLGLCALFYFLSLSFA